MAHNSDWHFRLAVGLELSWGWQPEHPHMALWLRFLMIWQLASERECLKSWLSKRPMT